MGAKPRNMRRILAQDDSALYESGGFTSYLVDLTGKFHAEKRYVFPKKGTMQYLEFLCSCIEELMGKVTGTVLSIGVTVPGVAQQRADQAYTGNSGMGEI